MLYGVIKKNTLVVAAADTLAEFEGFPPGAESERPDILDMMGDSFYCRLAVPPYLFQFLSVDELAAFTAAAKISIIGENRLAAKSTTMQNEAKPDPYAHTARITIEEDEAAIKSGAKVTIGSLHGITEEDRWDRRTEADKEKDRRNKEEYEKAKKSGNLSGDDSFGADTPKTSARATDVRITLGDDGKPEQINVLAVKGLYAIDKWTYAAKVDDGETLIAIVEKSQWEERKSIDAKRMLSDVLTNIPDGLEEIEPGIFKTSSSVEDTKKAMEENGFTLNQELQDQLSSKLDENADNDDPSIDPTGRIAIYFKMDVKGAKLVDIIPVLEGAGHVLTKLVRRNYSAGCWVAFIRKADAAKAIETLTAAGYTAEEYGVDDHGARLVAEGVEGVTVVDTEAPKEYGPRIWNDRAAEIETMDEDALKKYKKSFKGEEFIFCGEYQQSGRGTIVHIAPKEYFDLHGEMFPGNLDIAHILPDDFKEIEPGVFKTMGRDLHHTVSELAFRRHFVESLRLQLHLNNL